MSLLGSFSWSSDGWIVLTGVLCAVAATLLGNFLVLRRMSLLGDAISHAVLPGLAAAFLITGDRQSWPMFLGAVVVGILTALLTEWIRGVGRVDEGASMGVVFTSLFALGLVMIVRGAARVDLDPGCVLYGAIEFTPFDPVSVGGVTLPRATLLLAVVCLLNALFVILFFKELKLSSFDPALATSTGFHARWMHYALMILVAVTAVASFESVGNILVVAMFIVPPATAFLLVSRLSWMIGVSVVLAIAAAVLGHLSAVVVPRWFGFHSTTTAPMMAVATGILFGLAVVFSPKNGLLVATVRRQALARRILADDILAFLFRSDERGATAGSSLPPLEQHLTVPRWSLRAAIRKLARAGLLFESDAGVQLTTAGRERAASLVRSHRLWEQYLVAEAGLDVARIHDKAELFEHFTDAELRGQLHQATHAATRDPHGSPIPEEED